MPQFHVGDWVMVNDDYYSFTRRGSYGVVKEINWSRIQVLLIYANTPSWAEYRGNAFQQRNAAAFYFRLSDEHLIMLPNNIILSDEFTYNYNRFAVAFRISAEHYRLAPQPNSSVRSIEDIPMVIKRLHLSQQFYLEHKDELPSWTAGASS